MALVIGLAILMAFIALAGYYIGPGLGYYGAASLCFVLLLVIVYRVFAGGPGGRGMAVRPEVEVGPGGRGMAVRPEVEVGPGGRGMAVRPEVEVPPESPGEGPQ